MNPTNLINPINPTILLTFDVEDWFQVENFKQYIPYSSWPNCEIRVEKNVHKILDLLDSIKCNTAAQQYSNISSSIGNNSTLKTQHCLDSSPTASPLTPNGSIKATFFILGWLAERLPHLVREIKTRGHEIASHGYHHKLCREEAIEELQWDLGKSKKLLEDITGDAIYGYRAPNFSIDDRILKAIGEAGYLYDSSYNSYRWNKRYGHIKLFENHNGFPHQISEGFYEFPISNLRIWKGVLHWGGGGYFRLIPIRIFNLGVHSILRKNKPYLFYLHPWEFDPAQPRVNGISNYSKFRHYLNLDRTFSKFHRFLNAFEGYPFLTCADYLKNRAMVQ